MSIRGFLPHAEIGRISGQSKTAGQPGDGWYVAIQWLGWVAMFDILRATSRI